MSDLSIGDQTFRIEIEGDASRPALVLSNALGIDLGMWAPQMAEFAKHFRIVRYDPRGHGGTPVSKSPVSIATLGGDVIAILDALGIEKAHFLGLSMGGAVGLWLLANAPERIERAVLANTAPTFGDVDAWNARITSVLAEGMKPTARATMERWFTTDFATQDAVGVDAIQDVMLKTAPQGYAACCAALRDLDLREALHAVGHEVLVISGTDDPVVPTATLDAFIGGLPDAKHVAIEGRHLSNVEAAETFNAAVVDFLTAKPARARPASRRPAPTTAAPIKTVKRGGATRRSNAARSPLAKPASDKRASDKRASDKPDVEKATAHKPRPKTVPTPAPKATRATSARRHRAAPVTATTKTTTGKRAPAKAAPTKRATTTARTRLEARKTRAATKTRTTTKGRAAGKSPAKKAATKKTRKAAATTPVSTRRTTKTTAARAPIEKTKPRKATAKIATAKTAMKKTATKKTVRKAATKKVPAPRRSPAKKPRRPTGRRT